MAAKSSQPIVFVTRALPGDALARHATREKMARMAVDNLLAIFQNKKPQHCLNPEVLP